MPVIVGIIVVVILAIAENRDIEKKKRDYYNKKWY